MFNLQRIIIGLLLMGSPTICFAQGNIIRGLLKIPKPRPSAPVIISEIVRGVTNPTPKPSGPPHTNPQPITIKPNNPQGNIIGRSSIIETLEQTRQSSESLRRTLDSLGRERQR